MVAAWKAPWTAFLVMLFVPWTHAIGLRDVLQHHASRETAQKEVVDAAEEDMHVPDAVIELENRRKELDRIEADMEPSKAAVGAVALVKQHRFQNEKSLWLSGKSRQALTSHHRLNDSHTRSPSAVARMQALRAARKLLVHIVTADHADDAPEDNSSALVDADPFHFAKEPEDDILRSLSTTQIPAENVSFYNVQEICNLPGACHCGFEAYVQFLDADQCTVYFVGEADFASSSVGTTSERFSKDNSTRFAWLHDVYLKRVLQREGPTATAGKTFISKEGAEALAANGYPDAAQGPPALGRETSAASHLAALPSKSHDYTELIVDCPWTALVGTTHDVPAETRDKLQQYNLGGLPPDYFELPPPCYAL